MLNPLQLRLLCHGARGDLQASRGRQQKLTQP